MVLFVRRAPVMVSRVPFRLASTNSKQSLAYKGRIAKPIPAPGPGETTNHGTIETAQAIAAEKDVKNPQDDYQKRYKSKSRRIILAMVFSPIALVTSYHLYQRRKKSFFV